MKNNNKNFFLSFLIKNKKKLLLIGTPTLVIVISVGGYIFYENAIKTKTFIKKPTDVVVLPTDKEIIFPDINSIDFYDQIEFKNGEPFIGDKMISSIIKSVITRLGSTDGDVSFYIEEVSDT